MVGRYLLAVVLACCSLPGTMGPALANGPDERAPLELLYPVRGVGCYWERGEQYCSRYCYVEANLRQYCHPRLRHARPQGPVVVMPPPPARSRSVK